MVGSSWVNKIKADSLFKSCLVMLGWAQVPGIDCGGTFAPVCRLQSISTMLAIATKVDYEVLLLDVQTAFLKAAVEKEVDAKMAFGYETYEKSGVPFVMKLKKESLRSSTETQELVRYHGQSSLEHWLPLAQVGSVRLRVRT